MITTTKKEKQKISKHTNDVGAEPPRVQVLFEILVFSDLGAEVADAGEVKEM